MKKYIFLSAVIFSLVTACENEIPFKDMQVSPKLILNSLINIDSENNYVYLNYTGKMELGIVTDGMVTITVNGDLKETCTREEMPYTPKEYRYPVKTRFSPGDVVRIDAYAGNDKYHAWIEERVPGYPTLTTVDTLPTYFKDEYYYFSAFKQLKFKIGIKDIPNEKNFYRIGLMTHYDIAGKINEVKDTVITQMGNNLWPWDDIVLTDGHPASTEELENGLMERVRNTFGVFKDSRFANSEYTMTASTSYYLPDTYYLDIYDDIWKNFTPEAMDVYTTVHLQSITEDQYYYMNTLNSLNSDYYDPFLYDPVSIPSNVNGGTGFVGISCEVASERITAVKDYRFTFGEFEEFRK